MNYEDMAEVSVLEKLKRKLVGIAIIVVIVLSVILGIFLKGYTDAKKKYETVISELEAEVDRLSNPVAKYEIASKEINIDLIESKIEGIGEMATIEYVYTNAGKYEDPKQLFGIDIPLTTKSFIAKWDGIIKAGIEIDEVKVEMKEAKKEIIISLPKAKILSHELDENSFETLDEQDGLFNPVKVKDTKEFEVTTKKSMEERVIENGILDKAFENAKQIIEKLVNSDIVQEQGYSIKFKTLK